MVKHVLRPTAKPSQEGPSWNKRVHADPFDEARRILAIVTRHLDSHVVAGARTGAARPEALPRRDD